MKKIFSCIKFILKFLKINWEIPFVLAFSILIFKIPPCYNPSGKEYLLSTISQCLAATSALVFTISLVAAQLATKYSQRMLGRVFTAKTIIYMFFFVIGIILPLVVLKYPKDFLINISFIWAVTCLIYLIQYFNSLKVKLSPENLLIEERKKAFKSIRDTKELTEFITTIDNIIMTAHSNRDYDTFETGFNKLLEILQEIDEKSKLSEIIKFLEIDTSEIFIISEEKKCTDRIPEEREFLNNSFEEIYHRIDAIVNITLIDLRTPILVIRSLKKYGQESAKKGLGNFIKMTFNILIDITKTIYERGIGGLQITTILDNILQSIGHIGERTALNKLEEETNYAVGKIGEILILDMSDPKRRNIPINRINNFQKILVSISHASLIKDMNAIRKKALGWIWIIGVYTFLYLNLSIDKSAEFIYKLQIPIEYKPKEIDSEIHLEIGKLNEGFLEKSLLNEGFDTALKIILNNDLFLDKTDVLKNNLNDLQKKYKTYKSTIASKSQLTML